MRSTVELSPSMCATFLPPLCLLSASSSVLWTMTVTTTLTPFGDHGDAWASMSMVLSSFCLLYVTCCVSTSYLYIGGSFKGGTKVTGVVTQKQDSLGSGDYLASRSYFGSQFNALRLRPMASFCRRYFETQFRLLNVCIWSRVSLKYVTKPRV